MENHHIIPVLLTRQEAANQLRCSLTTLDRLGILCVKIRRRTYYKQDTINDWLTANEKPKEHKNAWKCPQC